MSFRLTKVLANKALGESGTEPITIKIKDLISAFRIMLIATSASTAWSNHPAANVTKIEIVDGSDVLYSLTGKCGEAIDFFQRPRARVSVIEFRNGRGCACVVDINFGRFLGDPELAFDPSKFVNPQLNITWDIDVCETSASVGTIEIDALVMENSGALPIGFLMSKEIKAYTPSSGTWEYTDLPLDYPLRTLGIQAQVNGSNLATSLADVVLSEDNDKRIPIRDTANNLARFYGSEMGEYSEFVRAVLTADQASYYCTPGYNTRVVGNSAVDASPVAIQTAQGGRFDIEAEVAGQAQFQCNGLLPHQVLALPFGRRDVIDTWYDVTRLGNLKLSLKGGSASTGTFRIITEQLRRY